MQLAKLNIYSRVAQLSIEFIQSQSSLKVTKKTQQLKIHFAIFQKNIPLTFPVFIYFQPTQKKLYQSTDDGKKILQHFPAFKSIKNFEN